MKADGYSNLFYRHQRHFWSTLLIFVRALINASSQSKLGFQSLRCAAPKIKDRTHSTGSIERSRQFPFGFLKSYKFIQDIEILRT